MNTKPRVIRVYSLCTLDCAELGGHVGEFRPCDRCGAPLHVRIFVIDHPALGELHVGSECFKDIMGYSYTTWHTKAVEMIEALRAKLAKWGCAGSVEFRRADGKRVTVYPKTYQAGFEIRHQLFGRDVKVDHAMSDSLARAALDLGLVTERPNGVSPEWTIAIV